jgi:hypothetical protein
MRLTLSILLALLFSALSRAGVQQDFFATAAKRATSVRIVKIGPDKSADGAMRRHVLLDAKEKKEIEAVVSMIEMIDPRPEKHGAEEEVWTGSVLSFGVAEYLLEFFDGAQSILSYGTDSSVTFVAPYGPHAPQGTDLLLDFPLTSSSAKTLKKFIAGLKEEPNQSLEPTAMLGTSAAEQPLVPSTAVAHL